MLSKAAFCTHFSQRSRGSWGIGLTGQRLPSRVHDPSHLFQDGVIHEQQWKSAKQFKVDRLQMIVVAKNLSVSQLFISRMPKMCAILQLVSAPLNPIPIAEHFRRSHPQCEHSYGQHIYMSKENNAK